MKCHFMFFSWYSKSILYGTLKCSCKILAVKNLAAKLETRPTHCCYFYVYILCMRRHQLKYTIWCRIGTSMQNSWPPIVHKNLPKSAICDRRGRHSALFGSMAKYNQHSISILNRAAQFKRLTGVLGKIS